MAPARLTVARPYYQLKQEMVDSELVLKSLKMAPKPKSDFVVVSAILVYFLFTQVTLCRAMGIRCSNNQIDWTQNGKTVGCLSCPPCSPGSEYSLICGTKVKVGTNAECKRCPDGKFSDDFDTKPCQDCTRCSEGRVTLRNCSIYQNAECSKECKPGYYKEAVVFACHKCVRCCSDGNDQKTSGCAVMGLCKIRPLGCPATPNTATDAAASTPGKPSTSPTSDLHLKGVTLSSNAISPSSTVHVTPTVEYMPTDSDISTVTRVAMPTATPSPIPFPPLENVTDEKGEARNASNSVDHRSINPESEGSIWMYVAYACIALLLLILVIIMALAAFYFCCYKKKSDDLPYSQSPVVVELTPLQEGQERLLEDWFERCIDSVDDVCKKMNLETNGRFVYERIAGKFGFSGNDIAGLEQERQRRHGCPGKMLLDKILCEHPYTTVRQLAENARRVGMAAIYKKLTPYFYKSS